MELNAFWLELEQRVGKYNLLCHPFYKAWTAGELTRNDLREYAADYYHHVATFPTSLATFHERLEDGELRRAVAANLADEEGREGGSDCRPHAEMWLDFAAGMGASRKEVRESKPNAGIAELSQHFHQVAQEASNAEALATFYAYESQVPRVAKEKARGLRELYGADAETCGYFTLHTTADVFHSNVWRNQLSKVVAGDPEAQRQALVAAESAAQSLWAALDGIESRRQERVAA
jgi:pyrroloquinoline-quinone synthase